MPHFTVHMVEEALDGEVETAVIRGLTEAIVEVYGERARPLAVVEILGVPRARWGVGGKAPTDDQAAVTLNMREPALHRVDDAPGRLIAAITDAVVDILGPDARERASVTVVGIPTGRSGVAGQPA